MTIKILMKKFKKRLKAFTLLEILLVVAVIAILAAIVILAINPSKQIEDTQNAKRASDTGTIFKALNQYAIDNSGDFPEGLSEEWKMLGTSDEDCNVLINDEIGETSTECLDLYNDLVPTYLANMPIDPTLGTQEKTYYAVSKSINGRIAVKSLLENESGNDGEGDEEGGDEETTHGPDAFVMEFSMSAGESLTIPMIGTGYNAVVDWGDDSDTSEITSITDPDATHTYSEVGNYQVSITGTFPRIYFNNTGNKDNLIKIIQWGDVGFTSFSNSFYGCSNLSSLPNGPIVVDESAIDFGQTFYHCSLEYIPNGFFDNTPNVTSFWRTFSYNSLTSIPEGLFDNTSNVVSFLSTFSNNSLTSIPEGLFDYTTKVTSFSSTFNINKITSIPEGLFDNTPDVTRFDGTFGSNELVTIPEGLFDNNLNVTDFSGTFVLNSLTSIPAELFKNNLNVADFENTFRRNSLTFIPEGLFDNNSNVIDFSGCFADNSLTLIPEGLFDYTPNVTDFSWIFSRNSLANFPETLFDNNLNVTDFSYLYYFNRDLTGNAPELWLRNPEPLGTNAFDSYYTSKLDNYDDIPSNWK